MIPKILLVLSVPDECSLYVPNCDHFHKTWACRRRQQSTVLYCLFKLIFRARKWRQHFAWHTSYAGTRIAPFCVCVDSDDGRRVRASELYNGSCLFYKSTE